MSRTKYSIAKEYTRTPGPRYIWQGSYSGEDFYKNTLKHLFQKVIRENLVLTIDLDYTAGYGPSFLEESFGSLVRDFGYRNYKKYLKIKSIEEPQLISEIEVYARKESR